MSDLEARLTAYLDRVWPEAGGVELVGLDRSTEGFSQETFFFDARTASGEQVGFVAKREPTAGLLEPYDLEPEFRVLHTLFDTGISTPRTPWFEADPSVLERPFYVMEKLPGRVPLPAPHADGSPPLADAERAALAQPVIDVLCRLHAIDWREKGLAFLGAPEPGGAAARELARWQARIDASGLAPAPLLTEALAWLRSAVPTSNDVAIVHGDYRLGNWLIDGAGSDTRLTGVLDWEMVHLGDPIEDLAWASSAMWRGGTTFAAALEPEDDFVGRYEVGAGHAVDRDTLHWYAVLSVVKMIAIEMTGVRAFLDGRADDLRMAIFDHQLPALCALLAVTRGWLPASILEAR